MPLHFSVGRKSLKTVDDKHGVDIRKQTVPITQGTSEIIDGNTNIKQLKI